MRKLAKYSQFIFRYFSFRSLFHFSNTRVKIELLSKFFIKKQLSRDFFGLTNIRCLFIRVVYLWSTVIFLLWHLSAKFPSIHFIRFIFIQRCHHAQIESNYSFVFEGSWIHQFFTHWSRKAYRPLFPKEKPIPRWTHSITRKNPTNATHLEK